jgi:hypothetical protein
MKKRLLWIYLPVTLLLGTAVLAALLEPTRSVRGLLAGEPFFRHRPASYWREVLRAYGRAGSIPREGGSYFFDARPAFPVLALCARDPDSNVRWPAIALLAKGDLRTQETFQLLLEALEDPDAEVRLRAALALSRWGTMARPAASALEDRLDDPDSRVACFADRALWQMDVPFALTATGWQRFKCTEFGFSVMMPPQAQREDRALTEDQGTVHSFHVFHRAGSHQLPAWYGVVVTEYAEGTGRETHEAEWSPVPGAKVVEEQDVRLGDLHGQERLFDVDKTRSLRTQVFRVGRRRYALVVDYDPRFLNSVAARFFFDSFRLDGTSAKPTGSSSQGRRSLP